MYTFILTMDTFVLTPHNGGRQAGRERQRTGTPCSQHTASQPLCMQTLQGPLSTRVLVCVYVVCVWVCVEFDVCPHAWTSTAVCKRPKTPRINACQQACCAARRSPARRMLPSPHSPAPTALVCRTRTRANLLVVLALLEQERVRLVVHAAQAVDHRNQLLAPKAHAHRAQCTPIRPCVVWAGGGGR